MLILVMSAGLAWLMWQIFQQGVYGELRQVRSEVTAAAQTVKRKYELYISQHPAAGGISGSDFDVLLNTVLSDYDGIEGGIWSGSGGFIAYAFPSYGAEKGMPEAERPGIEMLVRKTLASRRPQTVQLDRKRRKLIIYASPLSEHAPRLVVWTMGWAAIGAAAGYQNFVLGLAVLFVFALLSGLWLGQYFRRWSMQVKRVEQALSGAVTTDIQPIAETGEIELDRIVAAFNKLGNRWKLAQEEALKLANELARSERLSMLGRMVAAVAHEIRNPLGTIRLQAENAVQNPERQPQAMQLILEQVNRMERVVDKLLALSQIHDARRSDIAVADWLKERIAAHESRAREHRITLTHRAPDEIWSFDGVALGRAIDNLIANAFQHVPDGGQIVASARRDNSDYVFVVEDSGPGVPEQDLERIFEPFFTTRSDGTGLGLSIVREIAQSHDGQVKCVKGEIGARFEMVLPCPK